MNYFDKAVEFWHGKEKNAKRFAEAVCYVKGSETARLAFILDISTDTIEIYRNAFKMFREMETHMEDKAVAVLWEMTNVSLWTRGAKIRNQRLREGKNFPIERMYGYIVTAYNDKTVVETFAATVEVEESGKSFPKWARRLLVFRRKLEGFMSEKFTKQLPPVVAEKLNALIAHNVQVLKEISEMKI